MLLHMNINLSDMLHKTEIASSPAAKDFLQQMSFFVTPVTDQLYHLISVSNALQK